MSSQSEHWETKRQLRLLACAKRPTCVWLGLLAAERRGLEQGLEQGIKEGLEQGMRQKAIETAKKFLAEDIAPEMIAKCCSLPLEEVMELQKTPQVSK